MQVMKPCEEMFEDLGRNRPAALLDLLSSCSFDGKRLDQCDLTYAAEIAGRFLSSDKVVPVLFSLYLHESPIVREGVVLGLGYHLEYDGVVDWLRQVSNSEPNKIVKEIIVGFLE